jgi:hypothetical protein
MTLMHVALVLTLVDVAARAAPGVGPEGAAEGGARGSGGRKAGQPESRGGHARHTRRAHASASCLECSSLIRWC